MLVRLGREDLTRTLLKAGADTNIRTQQGQTPLELASEYAKGGSPESMAIVTVLQHVEGTHTNYLSYCFLNNLSVNHRNEGTFG